VNYPASSASARAAADVTEHAGAERIEGYKAAMNGYRLARETRVANAPLTERGGYDATRELLSDAAGVTAIFVGNDLCAFGVLDAFAELDMQVPGDVSVAGYDNTPVAGFQKISLTTVEQFAAEIGGEAMRSVLACVKRRNRPARHVMVPPQLIERATTGPHQASPRAGPQGRCEPRTGRSPRARHS
jgi:LacI family transcriptional regulator